MIDVTVEVKGKGTDSDFENEVVAKYYRVKSVAEYNFILKKLAGALFDLENDAAKVRK